VLLLRGGETITGDAADLQRLLRQYPEFFLAEPRQLPDWVLQALSNTFCKQSTSAAWVSSDSRRLLTQDEQVSKIRIQAEFFCRIRSCGVASGLQIPHFLQCTIGCASGTTSPPVALSANSSDPLSPTPPSKKGISPSSDSICSVQSTWVSDFGFMISG